MEQYVLLSNTGRWNQLDTESDCYRTMLGSFPCVCPSMYSLFSFSSSLCHENKICVTCKTVMSFSLLKYPNNCFYAAIQDCQAFLWHTWHRSSHKWYNCLFFFFTQCKTKHVCFIFFLSFTALCLSFNLLTPINCSTMH